MYFATLKQMLGIAFTNVEEVVVAAGVSAPGDAAQDTALLAQVEALGRRLG